MLAVNKKLMFDISIIKQKMLLKQDKRNNPVEKQIFEMKKLQLDYRIFNKLSRRIKKSIGK